MNCFKYPLLKLSKEKLLMMIFVVGPLLNFLFGISIDMYTPALPEMSNYFHTSYFQVHRTISTFMFGFSFGCLLLGLLMDLYGIRRVIVSSLVTFIVLCLLVLKVDTITKLQLLRFGQGFFIAAFSVGSRVLVFENFSGKRYATGITYTSFAYAFGTIVAPFMGGHIIEIFGWKYIFIAYALAAFGIFSLFFCFISDRKKDFEAILLKETVKKYYIISTNKYFLASSILLGTLAFQLMSFSILMPHFFAKMHISARVFGIDAMALGLFYLLGTLFNRVLITKMTIIEISSKGFILLGFSIFSYFLCSVFLVTSVDSLLIPSLPITFSIGLIFPNILGRALKQYPQNIGIAAATQSMLFMFFCTILNAVSSVLHFTTREEVAFYYIAIFILQMTLFVKIIKKQPSV